MNPVLTETWAALYEAARAPRGRSNARKRLWAMRLRVAAHHYARARYRILFLQDLEDAVRRGVKQRNNGGDEELVSKIVAAIIERVEGK
jgi:hypothetical protein